MRHAFDYVIVQVVPRVERDERVNVGAILFCPSAGFLGCRFSDAAERRLLAWSSALDLAAVARQLGAIRAVCAGAGDAGPVARLSASERFHWLSAARSTVVQHSAPHTGLCDDPALALDRLFQSAVAAVTDVTIVTNVAPRQP